MAVDEHEIRCLRDKWRYRCPNGHVSWEASANRFFCHECAYRNWPDNGSFETLVDSVTGEAIPREAFRFRGDFPFLSE